MTFKPTTLIYIAAPLAALLAGLASVVLGDLALDKPLLLIAPPMAAFLLLLLAVDRRKLLMAILVFRASGDVLFGALKLSVGGVALGIGGLINIFILALAFLLVVEKHRELPRRAIVPWVAFLLIAGINVVRAPVFSEAFRLYLAQLSYLAAFVGAFYVVRTREDFLLALKIVLWSSIVPAIYVFVEVATGGGQRQSGLRIQSTFGHPNIFGFYLAFVIAMLLYMLKTQALDLRKGHRTVLGLYMGYLLLLLLLTQARSAWIACFLLFTAYALIYERKYLFYLLLIPVLALLVPGVQDRIASLGEGNEYVAYARLNSFAWRRLIWETGIAWMKPSYYALGYGLESFKLYTSEFFPLSNGEQSGAHNVYVQLFFELGIIGLVCWLWVFLRVAKQVRMLAQSDRVGGLVFGGVVVQYLVVCASDNLLGYLSFNWYFWFIAGAAWALSLRSPVDIKAIPGEQQPTRAVHKPRPVAGAAS